MSTKGADEARTAANGDLLYYPTYWDHSPEPMLTRNLSVAHHNWMQRQAALEREANVVYLASTTRERRHATGVAS